jgi:hypothetical protein
MTSDDLDRLEALRVPATRAYVRGAAKEYITALCNAATALIAAARERDRLRAENERLKSLAPTDLDTVLKRWDQTDPAMQRKIVAAFAQRLLVSQCENERLKAIVTLLAAIDHSMADTSDFWLAGGEARNFLARETAATWRGKTNESS